MRSPEAISLLRHLEPSTSTPMRIILGKGIAKTIRKRFAAVARTVPQLAVPTDVAAIQSVHRTPPP
jgi:hypothetical protein